MKTILGTLFLLVSVTSFAQYNGNYLYDQTFNSTGYHVPHLGTSLTNTYQSVMECFYLNSNEIITVSRYSGLYNTSVNKPKVVLSKFNYNGALVNSFGNAGHQIVELNGLDSLNFLGAAQQDDDKIVIWVQGVEDYIVRYNANGTKDISFGTGGNYLIPNTLLQPTVLNNFFEYNTRNIISVNNKTIIGGDNTAGNPTILMLDNNGIPDISFNTTGYKEYYSNDPNKTMGQIAVNNNEITVVIENQNQTNTDTLFMFRMDLSGLAINSFGLNGYAFTKEPYGGSGQYKCKQIDFYQDGRMILQTENKFPTNFPVSLLNLYKTNGERDSAWGECYSYNPCVKIGIVSLDDGGPPITDILVDSSNNTYTAGINYKGLRRFSPLGIVDSSFGGISFFQFAGLSFKTASGTGFKQAVTHALALQPNGQLLVAGYVDTTGSQWNSNKNSLFVSRLLGSCINIPLDTLTNTTLCEGDTIKLQCNTSYPKKWHLNNVFTGDTSSTFSTTTSGNVYVTISDNGPCDTTSVISVSLVTPVIPVISQTGNTLVCNTVATSYQWYDASNVAIPGATQSSYTPSSGANLYSVMITNQYGCESKSTSFLFTPNSLVSYELKSAIKIYPNPTSRLLQIESSSQKVLDLKIKNMLGQEVFVTQIIPGKNQLDFQYMNLPTSVYYFVISHGTLSYTEKVVFLK